MIRILLAVAAVAGIVNLSSCSPCVGNGAPADAIAPVTLSDGGLGDACNTASQCSAGLDCKGVFAVSDRSAEQETFLACTQSCATAACPAGFVCVNVESSGLNPDRFCAPSCSTDADCRTGQRAGTCAGNDGGTLADGGTTGTCQPTVCGGGNQTGCPTGYQCQAYTYYGGNRCSGGGSSGAAAPPQGSWCGKPN